MEFGGYEIESQLAGGGMAELYLAHPLVGDPGAQKVVIKRLQPVLRGDTRCELMLLDEARIMSGLLHPNIAKTVDFGRVDGEPYLAIALVDGLDLATLASRCAEKGLPLAPELVLTICAAALSGLQYAHAAADPDGRFLEIVHLDVSPENILIGKNGEIRLCDFGIAASVERGEEGLSPPALGKLHYLSPEQVRGEKVDRRTDIFSMGVTLYELLAGQHPDAGGSGVSVLDTLLSDIGYPSIGTVAPWYSPAMIAAVDKSVAFNVKDRYEDADQFCKDIEAVLLEEYGGPVTAAAIGGFVETLLQPDDAVVLRRSQPPLPFHTAKKKPRRARMGMLLIVAVSLSVGILGLGLFSYFSPAQDSPDGRPPSNVNVYVPEEKIPAKSVESPPPQTIPTPDPVPAGAPENAAGTSVEKAAPIRSGTLDINASPWAEVRIDGKAVGTTPILGLKLSAGRHKVVFTNPDFATPTKRTVNIIADETTRLVVEMESPPALSSQP